MSNAAFDDGLIEKTSHPGQDTRGLVAGAVAFVLVALNLRVAVAAVPPVLTGIEHGTGLSSSVAGLLTTIPILCFGVFAFATPRLTRYLGVNRLLWLAMLLLAGGITLYLQPSVAALFGATLVTGAAIAIGNVLMPKVAKRDFGSRAGMMTGLYSMSLFVGAALSAGLTVPLESATGLGWRDVLALWAVPAVVAAAVWGPRVLRRESVPGSAVTPAGTASSASTASLAGPRLRALWHDPVAWAVTVFMGLQSLGYYAMLAWLPTIFADHHMAAGQAGWMLSYSSFPGMLSALATPLLVRRARHAQLTVVAAVVLCAIGYLGMITDPVPLAYLWMTVLGIGQGASITLALGFIVARSPDPEHAGQLSTMAQGVGYLIACLGPFGLGLLHSLTGGWTVPILVLIAVLVIDLIAGLRASRHRFILDAEPAPARLSSGYGA